jgi:GTP-binding protein
MRYTDPSYVPPGRDIFYSMKRDNIRNVAIIAHVDHGKTTLVDAMLKQTHTVSDGDLIMDSGDIERERGITITAKNASVTYNGVRINIVDTPGHADFGGEVERTLKMADGVLLLVDAKEGPMPQTKFVLKKALELGHRAIVVINKVDKPEAQVEEVVNKTFDLFVSLHASDEQLDFPIIYASGVNEVANDELQPVLDAIAGKGEKTITPVFEAIIKNIPAPDVSPEDPFGMLVLALRYDNYKGKIGIGKITSGSIKKAQNATLIARDGSKTNGKIASLQMYEGLIPTEVDSAEAGDIVAIGGFDKVQIGDTVADSANPIQIPPVEIEQPTIKMTFGVNTSPFAGREGTLLTSRQIRDRLFKELETNVALRVEEMGDTFLVSGRGELHLAVLIETMRREGFELQVSQPQVIYHEENGQKMEPYEELTIDVPGEHQGAVIEEVGRRGGEMKHMDTDPSGEMHLEYLIPTRGLIGLKNLLLTRTRGTVIINNLFDSYKPVHDIDLRGNNHGSLIASESGTSSAYGLSNAQERGVLFIGAAVDVYEGQIVGKNALDSDLELNVCKGKKLTNMRASGTDEGIILTPPKPVSLDFALEYIGSDELAEVTPQSIRLRKRILTATERKRDKRN